MLLLCFSFYVVFVTSIDLFISVYSRGARANLQKEHYFILRKNLGKYYLKLMNNLGKHIRYVLSK